MPLFVPATVITVQQTDRAKLLADVEEQYELTERKGLAVTTGGQSYTITTVKPKVVNLIADGDDMLVDTKTLDADSPKLFKSGSMVFTLKGKATTIYAKALSTSGTLFIMVYA